MVKRYRHTGTEGFFHLCHLKNLTNSNFIWPSQLPLETDRYSYSHFTYEKSKIIQTKNGAQHRIQCNVMVKSTGSVQSWARYLPSPELQLLHLKNGIGISSSQRFNFFNYSCQSALHTVHTESMILVILKKRNKQLVQCSYSLQTWVYQCDAYWGRGMITMQRPINTFAPQSPI